MSARPVARVLLHAPLPQLDRLLDYAIPPALTDDAVPGVRVRVPLRGAGRLVEGYIVELGVAEDPDRPLSELESVLSAVPVLPRSLYALARRVADRAAGSASDILRLVIPRRQVRIEKAWVATHTAADATPDDRTAKPDAPVWAESSARARTVLDAFPGLADALTEHARCAVDAVPRPTTTVEESAAETIGSWAELLAAAAVHTLTQGRSAVLIVPDYRDLDQLELALAGLVAPDLVVRDDGARTPAQRSRAYLRMLEPEPCIVIGNRSAVYAPVSQLGLIALWDDGDPLLEEPLAPYVHARDAALVRQELDGCALLFSGHTRTADVERLVAIGWVRDMPAARRYSPRIVISANDEGRTATARVSSAAFRAAREALEHGPVLVQVARPGYAPVLTCGDCRRPARCTACGGPLHTVRRGSAPSCRWCGRAAGTAGTPWSCAHCSGTTLRMASAGSARTADEFGRAFPGIRIVLADGEHRVQRVDAAPALVIATRGAEPIATGGYRAVILLDGERMLQAESLRIGEACLRWWSNAAALAAPGAPVHLVGVAGSIARALATWSQAAYARTELAERAPLQLPPVVRIAAVDGPPAVLEGALAALRAAVPSLRSDDILGPVLRPSLHDARPSPAGDEGAFRALVRFDYAEGAAVAASLRASVVQAALRTRRPARGRSRGGAPATLRVRLDVPEPEL